jgi:hypothetical protein
MYFDEFYGIFIVTRTAVIDVSDCLLYETGGFYVHRI